MNFDQVSRFFKRIVYPFFSYFILDDDVYDFKHNKNTQTETTTTTNRKKLPKLLPWFGNKKNMKANKGVSDY